MTCHFLSPDLYSLSFLFFSPLHQHHLTDYIGCLFILAELVSPMGKQVVKEPILLSSLLYPQHLLDVKWVRWAQPSYPDSMANAAPRRHCSQESTNQCTARGELTEHSSFPFPLELCTSRLRHAPSAPAAGRREPQLEESLHPPDLPLVLTHPVPDHQRQRRRRGDMPKRPGGAGPGQESHSQQPQAAGRRHLGLVT